MNKEIDYIIVGLGIAGISLCHRLLENGHTFIAVDSGIKGATRIAGGVVNPVVLKKFTPAWKSDLFLEESTAFYKTLEDAIEVSFVNDIAVHRVFANAQEQKTWMMAKDKEELASFLVSEIVPNNNNEVHAPFGFGEVKRTFRINSESLIQGFRGHLQKSNQLISEEFNHSELKVEKGSVQYKNISAKRIVFAEGAQVIDNPFFTIDSFIPKKGQYIIVKAPKLKLNEVLKGRFFIIPLGEDLYKVGATFGHGDFSYDITQEGRQQIEDVLRKMIQCDFDVVEQMVGMRPTVKDRRPLMGTILEDDVVFFNGLGTRGIQMAPLLSKWLYDYLERDAGLPSEVDIKRFVN